MIRTHLKKNIFTPNHYFQRGTSLIEVIIALAIVLLLFYMLTLQINTFSVSLRQRYENIAYHIANKQIEVLRATSLAALPSSGAISDSLLAQIPSGAGSFTVNDYASYAGMKEFVVTVNWNDGGAKSVVLKTLAGTGGMNPE